MRTFAWCLCSLLLLQLAGCGARSQQEATTRAGSPDDFLGIWVPDASPRALLSDGAAPPLNADAAAVHAAHQQRLAAGDTGFDPTSWCAGPGMPRILTMPYAFEIRRTADHLAFIHGWYRWFRAVDLNGPAVTEAQLPLTMGFPVGRFEDGALVIRTVGLNDSTVLDASGLPHSDQTVLTERWRLLPDGRLENRLTIEDPETFTRSWETVLTFHRDPAAQVNDDICPDRLARGEPAERSAPATAPAPRSATTATAADRPSSGEARRFTGLWEPKTFGFMVQEARLNASGKAIVDRNAAAMAGGRIMQTAWTSCRPGAVSSMTMPRERILVLEHPSEITILYEMPRMVRRIRMNSQHPPALTPSSLGDSIGSWEGDTLVVDSIGFDGYAELDARGQPTSPQLHTVERFTLSPDGGVDIEVTMTDPEYYAEPVHIQRSWKKSANRHPLEYDCMENPRQEDFENAYFVRDRYLPVCQRVEGEGMELSRMVCRN